jgi:hypothetical protein
MGWNMYVCGRVASLSLPTFAGEKDLYISVYVPVLVGIPYRFCSIQDLPLLASLIRFTSKVVFFF